MCYSCHIKLSDEEIKKQLSNLENIDKSFNIYNSTSLSHLILSSSGYNGIENRNLALNIIIKYYHWNINKNKIIDNDKVSSIIGYLLNNTIDKNKNDLIKYIEKI